MTDIVERLREGCGCNFPETTCMAESECADAFAAADEIARLRSELHAARVWAERVIAEHEQDITKITVLRAENDRLLEDLIEAEKYNGYHQQACLEIERLREWNREIALNAREFAADNERLRAALGDVHAAAKDNHLVAKLARAALEGK